MVIDVPGQPVWTFDKPILDRSDHTYWSNDTAMDLAHLINDAIVPDAIGNTLTINVGCRFPDNAFKQCLANTWGSIECKAYFVAKGSWNGDLFDTTEYGGPFPDWWLDWANQGLGLSLKKARAGQADAGLDQVVPTSYCGSGPYYLQTIDPVNLKVILQKNPDFWMGWPATGRNSISTRSK